MASVRPIELFYSYSHRGEDLRDELERHLKILQREGAISNWHDRRITAGREWGGEISEHLESSGIILLLVSADFIASDYCWDVEVKRAIERHEAGTARVIPVILRDCDWHSAPFGKLQALPKDGKPITSWPNRDEAFADVARGIRKAIEELTLPHARGAAVATTTSVIFSVPHNRNPNFTGRAELLDQLHAQLAAGESVAMTAINGLGGVGKTQIAVEYCYRHRDAYPYLWWLRAEEPASLAAGFAAIAADLGLPEAGAQEQERAAEAVRRWLRANGGWLLVFDNAASRDAVKPYHTPGARGRVIITSRDPNWGGVAQKLDVRRWERAESVEFLLRRTGSTDREAAGPLAEALGDLPLALAQAAAYIEATGCTIAHYRALFEQRAPELLRQHPPDDYDQTVATTWSLAFAAVERESPEAAELLRLCAFLAPDDIPIRLLLGREDLVPDAMKPLLDPVCFDKAVEALRRYSLVEVADDSLSVHRLVQAVIGETLDGDGRGLYAAAAVTLVNAVFPYDSDDYRYWPACAVLLAHALAAASNAERCGAELATCDRVLNQAGGYLRGRAQYESARLLHERGLHIAERVYGPDHHEVATDLNNLGLVLKALGNLLAARDHLERALAISEPALGPDHPDVANSLINLGAVLHDLGDLPGARKLHERALAILERALGPDHLDVANSLSNLGTVLGDLGDLPAARVHHERALAIFEKALGSDHPGVATSLSNLGSVLQNLGDLPAAREHYDRALGIHERALGPDHPDVAYSLNNLGTVLRDLGDLSAARAHLEHALAILQQAHGPDHPDVARSLNNLGAVLQALGDLPAARAHFERALAIREQALGPDHPDVANSHSNLGAVLADLGDLPAARECAERALDIRERTLGPDHPDVANSHSNLGAV
ncbi:MAG: FxSxx-COOH system tetratricopeptide repeat protein, partial [Dehalococcoidia bacterium]